MRYLDIGQYSRLLSPSRPPSDSLKRQVANHQNGQGSFPQIPRPGSHAVLRRRLCELAISPTQLGYYPEPTLKPYSINCAFYRFHSRLYFETAQAGSCQPSRSLGRALPPRLVGHLTCRTLPRSGSLTSHAHVSTSRLFTTRPSGISAARPIGTRARFWRDYLTVDPL